MYGPAGTACQAKYGVLGIGIPPAYADGMNEAGLTVALQSLYRSEYQKCDFFSKLGACSVNLFPIVFSLRTGQPMSECSSIP